MLNDSVRQKEKRETVLSNRVRNLEDRADTTDERLAIARKDLKMLSDLGISPDNLSALVQRLKGIAQRHSMSPDTLSSRLMDELEQLDQGVRLNTIVRAMTEELKRLEEGILKAKGELETISTTNDKLRQEHTLLKAALTEGRRHFVTDVRSINTVVADVIAEMQQNLDTIVRESSIEINQIRSEESKALNVALREERKQIVADLKAIHTTVQDTVTELKEKLGDGVADGIIEINKLSNQALMLGRELGQFNEIIESNSWLKGLHAMVKGDDEIELTQIRVIGITVMRAVLKRLNDCKKGDEPSWLLKQYIVSVIGELEKWKL